MAISLLRSRLGKSIASPGSSPLWCPSRGRLRGPPRIFGWTKTQALDLLMRTNAGICAFVSFSILPVILFWLYRYQTVLKPQKVAYEKKRMEELLSEGKAIQSKSY